MCNCTEYKLSALQVTISEENKLNATTQQFIMAKISGCALKQGSKTHSSLCQSDLPLQNQAALISYRIRAVELRKCAAGLSNASPGLQDRILLNYTRIESAHEVRKKTFVFLLCIDVRCGFTIRLKRLKPWAPNFGGPQNFGSRTISSIPVSNYTCIFVLVQRTFFTTP